MGLRPARFHSTLSRHCVVSGILWHSPLALHRSRGFGGGPRGRAASRKEVSTQACYDSCEGFLKFLKTVVNEAFQQHLEGSQRTSLWDRAKVVMKFSACHRGAIWMPQDRTKASWTRRAQLLPQNAFTRRGTWMLFKPWHCIFPRSVKCSAFISKATDPNLNFILLWHSCWLLGKTLSELDYYRNIYWVVIWGSLAGFQKERFTSIVCIWVIYANVCMQCMYTTYLSGPWSAQHRAEGSPGTWLTEGCEPPQGTGNPTRVPCKSIEYP